MTKFNEHGICDFINSSLVVRVVQSGHSMVSQSKHRLPLLDDLLSSWLCMQCQWEKVILIEARGNSSELVHEIRDCGPMAVLWVLNKSCNCLQESILLVLSQRNILTEVGYEFANACLPQWPTSRREICCSFFVGLCSSCSLNTRSVFLRICHTSVLATLVFEEYTIHCKLISRKN